MKRVNRMRVSDASAIIIIIHEKIKVTLSQKCCRGTVQTTSHVCSHSNSYNWRNYVRASLKDALNSSVFICRLNAMYESEVLTDAGRAFQARTAATENARSPSVVNSVNNNSRSYVINTLSSDDCP